MALPNNHVTTNELHIRDWTISDNAIGLVLPPADNHTCCVQPRAFKALQSRDANPDFKYYSLRRPGSTYCAAVVQVEDSGKKILNPSGFNYGPIPKLSEMTPSQADELWGTNVPKHFRPKSLKTYKLKAHHDPSNSDFFIDLVFKNNKIEEYRVRTNQHDVSKWQIVL